MSERQVIIDQGPKPTRIRVYRDGRTLWTEIPPNHPRFKMSLDPVIFDRLDQETRFVLCEKLAKHIDTALAQWADCPITVYVPELDLHVNVSDNPDKAGNVLVRPG